MQCQAVGARARERERERGGTYRLRNTHTNRKCSRSASDHTKLRHSSLSVLSCCARFGTITLEPTSGCPGAETFKAARMKNDLGAGVFARSFASTLFSVGHIILLPPASVKYWNNCPLGGTLQALTSKGNCKYAIMDTTQAFSRLKVPWEICGCDIVSLDQRLNALWILDWRNKTKTD